MELEYSNTQAEHEVIRSACGLVDYRGLGLFKVTGRDDQAYVGGVITRNVDFLLEGQSSSALLLRQDGTVLAEVLVYRTEDAFLLEVPSTQAARAWTHLHTQADNYDELFIADVSDDFVAYGLEGPRSFRVIQGLLPFPVSSMSYMSFVPVEVPGSADSTMLVSRTGVTGEYGYKLHVPVEHAAAVQDQLVAAGADPVGLAALRVARMEARFADLDTEVGAEKLTPFDLGIQWMVSFDDHEFVGRDRLLDYWQSDPAIRPVCWRADGAVVPEPGADVYIDGEPVGVVGFAVHSPRLDAVIGTARLESSVAAVGVELQVGSGRVPGLTTSAPFLVPTSFGVTLE
jgi:aminomethyltransferase